MKYNSIQNKRKNLGQNMCFRNAVFVFMLFYMKLVYHFVNVMNIKMSYVVTMK